MTDESLPAEHLSALATLVDDVLARLGYEMAAAIDAIDDAVPGYGGLFDPTTTRVELQEALERLLASELTWPPVTVPAGDGLVLYVDGSSRGNPGPAGAGAVILDTAGDELARLGCPVGARPGNNTAEYVALQLGLSQLGSLLGVSMPNFWLGYLLIIVFALHLPILPVAGAESLSHLVLPTLTLGSGMAAILTRLVRTSMLNVLDTDYVRTARAKGLRNRIVVYKHAFRNALLPVTTVAGLQLAFVLNGAVVVEVVFARPGLGTLLVDAIFARNYPVVQGVILLTAALFVTVNFLVDVLYHVIDPRIQGDPQ